MCVDQWAPAGNCAVAPPLCSEFLERVDILTTSAAVTAAAAAAKNKLAPLWTEGVARAPDPAVEEVSHRQTSREVVENTRRTLISKMPSSKQPGKVPLTNGSLSIGSSLGKKIGSQCTLDNTVEFLCNVGRQSGQRKNLKGRGSS